MLNILLQHFVGELLQRLSRQQKITDDIITRQRQLMEGTYQQYIFHLSILLYRPYIL